MCELNLHNTTSFKIKRDIRFDLPSAPRAMVQGRSQAHLLISSHRTSLQQT